MDAARIRVESVTFSAYRGYASWRMPVRRSPIYVVALVVLLLGLSSYLTISVFASGGEDFVFPEVESIVEASGADAPLGPIHAEGPVALEVEVSLRPKIRILPPAGSGEQLCRLVSADEVLAAPATFVAGPRAVDPSRRDRGRHLVRFDCGEGLQRYRIVTMPEGDAVVDLDLGSDLYFLGEVVTRDGKPVAGAEVWAGESRAGVLQTVQTDRAGKFSIVVAGGQGVPLMVRAEGWASQYRVVQVSGVQARDFVFQLDPSASVRVQFAAQINEPERGRVFVLPSGSSNTDGVSIALLQYPFFLHGIGNGLQLDASGACEVSDLPRSVDVSLLVQHPQVASVRPVRHRLGSRSKRPVVVQVGRGPELAGRVVDLDGKPIAGALVVSRLSRPRIRSAHALLPAGALEISVSRMRCDAKGYFRIRRPADDCLITASADSFCGAQVLSRKPSAGQEYGFVLPPSSAMGGSPKLSLSLPGELRSRQVRVTDGGDMGNLRLWTGGAPLDIDLECMAFVDVDVVVTDRGTGERRRVLSKKSLAVLGAVVLELVR